MELIMINPEYYKMIKHIKYGINHEKSGILEDD